MSINFPTTLDTLSNPSAGDLLENATTVLDHDQQHSNANDAIEALEAKVGANSSAVTTSHDYKLGEVTGTDKAVGKTAPQTMTNKTLTSPVINLGSNATGDIYYRDSGGTFQRLPIGTSTQILQVSSGGIPEWTTNANATAPNYFTAVADEDLTIGAPVGISNTLTGLKVSKAKLLLYSKTITPDIDNAYFRIKYISTNKGIVLYKETGATNLKVVCFTVNTSNYGSAFTFGTAVSVSTTFVSLNTQDGLACMGTDKFAVTYVESGATTAVKLVIGTVSGTTITLGTPITARTMGATVQEVAIAQLSTDKGVLICGSSTPVVESYAFTVSTTTPTMGAVTTMTSANMTQQIKVCNVGALGTDKFAVVGGSNPKYVQIGTVSGTTITLGTATSTGLSPTNDYKSLDIVSPTTDVIVCKFHDGNNIICATIATRTPTFGTAIAGSSGNGALYVNSTTEIYVSSASNQIKKITRSGSTLTDSGQILLANNVSGNQGNFVNMSTYWMIQSFSGTTHTYFIQGMSNNFVGIAQGTVSKGGSLTVITSGIDSNQSGLIAGAYYGITNGIFDTTITSSAGTEDTIDDKYVLALSATQVLI